MPSEARCGCGSSDLTLRWRSFADGRKHIEQKCAECGAHKGWAKQTPENLELVQDPARPTAGVQAGLFAPASAEKPDYGPPGEWAWDGDEFVLTRGKLQFKARRDVLADPERWYPEVCNLAVLPWVIDFNISDLVRESMRLRGKTPRTYPPRRLK